jgi:hypothetical protein
MSKILKFNSKACNRSVYGFCSEEFWNIMKKNGKPGLSSYTCILWRNKIDKINQYWEAVSRIDNFDLRGLERQTAIEKILARHQVKEISCQNFRPGIIKDNGHPKGLSRGLPKGLPRKPGNIQYDNTCRYYFHETCAMHFKICHETCDDFKRH